MRVAELVSNRRNVRVVIYATLPCRGRAPVHPRINRLLDQSAHPITRSPDQPDISEGPMLIRHGTVVTARETRQADVLIEGERISQVGMDLAAGSMRGRFRRRGTGQLSPAASTATPILTCPLATLRRATISRRARGAAAFGEQPPSWTDAAPRPAAPGCAMHSTSG